jgi:phage pi2 protein 07
MKIYEIILKLQRPLGGNNYLLEVYKTNHRVKINKGKGNFIVLENGKLKNINFPLLKVLIDFGDKKELILQMKNSDIEYRPFEQKVELLFSTEEGKNLIDQLVSDGIIGFYDTEAYRKYNSVFTLKSERGKEYVEVSFWDKRTKFMRFNGGRAIKLREDYKTDILTYLYIPEIDMDADVITDLMLSIEYLKEKKTYSDFILFNSNDVISDTLDELLALYNKHRIFIMEDRYFSPKRIVKLLIENGFTVYFVKNRSDEWGWSEYKLTTILDSELRTHYIKYREIPMEHKRVYEKFIEFINLAEEYGIKNFYSLLPIMSLVNYKEIKEIYENSNNYEKLEIIKFLENAFSTFTF